MKTENKCILCKEDIKGFGNNAQPLAEGRCCDECNIKVIAKRIGNIEEADNVGDIVEEEMTTHDRMDGLILISDKEKIKSATKSIMIDLHREGFYVEDIMQFIYELARGEIK